MNCSVEPGEKNLNLKHVSVAVTRFDINRVTDREHYNNLSDNLLSVELIQLSTGWHDFNP